MKRISIFSHVLGPVMRGPSSSHTAAANASPCADLVLGGYVNPIPLDEILDAVYAVGRMMTSELRCTAAGGLAVAPSALAMKPQPCPGCGDCS
jgi:L-serine deaminase